MGTKRIFAAIDLSREARDAVVGYAEQLRADLDDNAVRWERPEKLHITINFAGDLDEEQLAEYVAAVHEAASSVSRFTIRIGDTGRFLHQSRGGVLWLGLATERGAVNPLQELAGCFLNAPGKMETREFKPHLTIGRFRDAHRVRHLIDTHVAGVFGPVSFEAAGLDIYESRLLPAGSVFTVNSHHPFR